MLNLERAVILLGLGSVLGLATIDIALELRAGVSTIHLWIEISVTAFALIGYVLLIKGNFQQKCELVSTKEALRHLNEQSISWNETNKKFVRGLGLAIEEQFYRWGLSSSEKEIAMFMLKGLSLKEIADLRKTSERTVRTQTVAIYQKSGLAGRSELSAFFLEDLLTPRGGDV